MDIPRPEHPQPQFRRKRWLNLNGPWEFGVDCPGSGLQRGWQSGHGFDRTIIVPFAPESASSGLALKDFMPSVWYRRMFRVPQEWQGDRILLHFGAVDYEASVWVNDRLVAMHSGGQSPFQADITEALRAGDNELVVLARDDTRSPLQPTGKQSQRYESYGCLYTRTTGIWQTVWLEPVPRAHIAGIRIMPDLASGNIVVQAAPQGLTAGMSVRCRVTAEGEEIAVARTSAAAPVTMLILDMPSPRAWSPGDPFLHDMEIELVSGDRVVDSCASYFGMRSIELDGSRFLINGERICQRLVLDQGFYPDGIYTAPSDEALRGDIELAQAVGFNGARLHQKVFEPRFLYWADRLGYLVWGEYPSWGMDIGSAQAVTGMLAEWSAVVARDQAHPSIVGWCPFNETGGDRPAGPQTLLLAMTKALDPGRPVLDTSGYVHVPGSDVYDSHDYDQDPETFRSRHGPFASGEPPYRNSPEADAPYTGQPYFVSEFGGIKWNPGAAVAEGWGYGEGPGTEAEFMARLAGLVGVLLDNPRMFGFCYTQLYDVEQEVNGLYTYDRRCKFDVGALRSIFAGESAYESGGG